MGTARGMPKAERALRRNPPIVRALAVHEAGHCVARVLTAGVLGWGIGEVIQYIEASSAPIAAGTVGLDSRHGLRSQVVSWGRFLSKPMQRFVAARTRGTPTAARGRPLGHDYDLAPLFAEMRAAGIDLDAWFRTKSIVAIFGPMAEAKLLERPFSEVWNNDACKDDTLGLIRAGVLCGMTPDRIALATSENIFVAEQQMLRAEVWRAIIALADSIEPGRMSGRTAAAIIVRAMATSEATLS